MFAIFINYKSFKKGFDFECIIQNRIIMSIIMIWFLFGCHSNTKMVQSRKILVRTIVSKYLENEVISNPIYKLNV